MTLLYILICALLFAFFAGTEMAFMASNKLNIELKRKQGTTTGKILGNFINKPYLFGTTSTIGIALTLVAYSLLITNVIELPVEKWLLKVDIRNELVLRIVQLLLSTLVATIVILLLAELLPKAIFKSKANQILSLSIIPISMAHYFLYPIGSALLSMGQFILKYLFNVRINEKTNTFVPIHLEQFISETLYGNENPQNKFNHQLFDNALRMLNLQVRNCMVPRNEIIGVESQTSVAELKQTFIQSKLSKILVFEKNIDYIIGYIYHLDILEKVNNLKDIMHPIPVVPETMTIANMMEKFKKERKTIALVVDEFGGTAGIVTMDNILEQLFGEINDEFDSDEFLCKQLSDAEWLLSGRITLNYLQNKFALNFPFAVSETLSGYIIAKNEKIPNLKDRIIIGQHEFDILSVSETRIVTVKLRLLN